MMEHRAALVMKRSWEKIGLLHHYVSHLNATDRADTHRSYTAPWAASRMFCANEGEADEWSNAASGQLKEPLSCMSSSLLRLLIWSRGYAH